MIKKALLVTVVLLIAQSLFFMTIAKRSKITRHQWQYNNLIAQNFLYGADTFQNVIVGSSLSQRLPEAELPEFYNLSFAGLSCLDGLELLTYKAYLPRRVFIETNFFTRPKDESFTETLEAPLLFYPRKYVPGLREGRQPMDWVAIALDRVCDRINIALRDPNVQVSIDTSSATAKRRFDAGFNVLVDRYSKPPVRDILDKTSSELKTYVDKLTAKGVEVIFFELPVNPKLCNAPFATSTRQAIESMFPADHYKIIGMPDCSAYHTSDGIHLTENEVPAYIKYFRQNAF
ncbi:MAG: hypothetical protein WDO14_10730 [Bacteroidota bacterium]